MGKLAQQIVDGLASGSIYASTALALVFVFRSTHIINFAQGEMAMFSTYLAWSLSSSGFPIWAAIGVAVTVSFLAGALIERVVVRHFEKSSVLTVVIVTLGLALLVNSLAGLRWGFLIKPFPNEFPDRFFNLEGVRFSVQSVGVTAVLLGVVVVLWLLFQHTKLGLALRAVAANQQTCRLSGVRVGRMLMFGWGMAAALGALAGVLVAPKVFLQPNMMASILLYAFAGAVLGGFDSPVGAVVGGMIVGVTENLAGTYIHFIGTDLKVSVPLVLILGVLLIRPQGLFGSQEVARV
jgi:branched-chain amino acid transport system permease protein